MRIKRGISFQKYWKFVLNGKSIRLVAVKWKRLLYNLFKSIRIIWIPLTKDISFLRSRDRNLHPLSDIIYGRFPPSPFIKSFPNSARFSIVSQCNINSQNETSKPFPMPFSPAKRELRRIKSSFLFRFHGNNLGLA